MVIHKSKGAEVDFPSIETYLGSALKPIQPRAVFVSGLRSRLETEARTRRVGLSLAQYALIAAIGVASSLLLLATGARAIAAIIGVFGLLRLSSGRTHSKPTAALLS